MDQIRHLAIVSVARACAFALLAILSVMVGLSFDPLLAAKSGAILFSGMVAVLLAKAWRAPHKPYRRTEVWLMLDGRPGGSDRRAQQMIPAILRDVFMQFATIAAVPAVALWVVTGLIAATA